jgi:hypothetical protein
MENLTWVGWGNTLASGAYHSFGDLVICRMVFKKYNILKSWQISSVYLILTSIDQLV